MPYLTLFSLFALAALIPAAVGAWRPSSVSDRRFWLLTGLAFAGSAGWVAWRFGGAWHSGLAATLWVAVAVSIALFAGLARFSREGGRLAPLLFPYLILLGLVATIWEHAPEESLSGDAPSTWILIHIAVSVVTYGLLTLSAIAGLAVMLREREVRSKRRGVLSDLLPSVAGAEFLQVRLLVASECVLGLGLASGIATQFVETGRFFTLDHKTLLTLGAFILIGGLLTAHFRTGLRGRRAARLVLMAYLLVTLGYPGVKFVRDVLLG